jgi:hypothetical protein
MIEKDVDANTKKHDWQSFQAKVGGKKKNRIHVEEGGQGEGEHVFLERVVTLEGLTKV